MLIYLWSINGNINVLAEAHTIIVLLISVHKLFLDFFELQVEYNIHRRLNILDDHV